MKGGRPGARRQAQHSTRGYMDVAGVAHALARRSRAVPRRLVPGRRGRQGGAWSGPTAPARPRCCGWSPATCRCASAWSRRAGGLGVMRQFIGMVGDETTLQRAGALARRAAGAGRGRAARPRPSGDARAERGADQQRAGKAQVATRTRSPPGARPAGTTPRCCSTPSVDDRARPAVGRRRSDRPVRTLSGGQQKRLALELLLARHRRGAAARRARQLPRRTRRSAGSEARLRESDKSVLYVVARPRAARPDRRPGGRGRGRHSAVGAPRRLRLLARGPGRPATSGSRS